MRAPEFWSHRGAVSRLLLPLGRVWAWATAWRIGRAVPYRASVPVICVGNLTVGGAGKTPVCLALARKLTALGLRPHVLTRGYGGEEKGPHAVDPDRDDAERVGDEALLLARLAPVWVARDRAAGARAAAASGAGIIVMDDGHQNPTLAKDLSLVVVDGETGFGNGRVIPAGPLREPVAAGLARADALVVMGEDRGKVETWAGGLPVLRARLVPGPEVLSLRGRRVVAFAGIGRPGKFFQSLREAGAEVVAVHPFADHYPYAEADIQPILDEAFALDAIPVTTAKDAVRLPPDQRQQVTVLTARVQWANEDALDGLLSRFAARIDQASGPDHDESP